MDVKAPYLRRLSALTAERAPYLAPWQAVRDFVLPWHGRFPGEAGGKARTINTDRILDNTATLAHRVLASGLMAGVTSPARPWFRLGVPDPRLAENAAVKLWLHDAERMLRTVFARSNLYNALAALYEELAAFGPAVMLVHEDPDPDGTVVTAQTLTIGQYCLAQDAAGRVNTLYRECDMTVAQVVEEFGAEAVSAAVRRQHDAGRLEAPVRVVQVIEPDPAFGRDPAARRFREVWFETAGERDRLLRQGGYDSFPALCPRWGLVGTGDVYGWSPLLSALGDVRQLQAMERAYAQAVAKMVNPPLVAPSSLRGIPVNALPGGVNFVDSLQGGAAGVRSLYDVQPRTVELQQSMEFVRQRIRRACYEDVWLMVSDLDRATVTATEIDARRQEKLLMLGPVLERLHHDLLDPLVERVFRIMVRQALPDWQRGFDSPLLPLPPPELRGLPLRVEYISVLADAQKAAALGGIERVAAFVGTLAGAYPQVRDKFDADQAVDEFADAVGAPVRLVRPDPEVASLRAGRDQQQAAQQQLQALGQVAEIARTGALAAKAAGFVV